MFASSTSSSCSSSSRFLFTFQVTCTKAIRFPLAHVIYARVLCVCRKSESVVIVSVESLWKCNFQTTQTVQVHPQTYTHTRTLDTPHDSLQLMQISCTLPLRTGSASVSPAIHQPNRTESTTDAPRGWEGCAQCDRITCAHWHTHAPRCKRTGRSGRATNLVTTHGGLFLLVN